MIYKVQSESCIVYFLQSRLKRVKQPKKELNIKPLIRTKVTIFPTEQLWS